VLQVKRPIEDVFDFVANERHEPRIIARLLHAEQTSVGPIGLGTRFWADTNISSR
jgi:hypothetical protein